MKNLIFARYTRAKVTTKEGILLQRNNALVREIIILKS